MKTPDFINQQGPNSETVFTKNKIMLRQSYSSASASQEKLIQKAGFLLGFPLTETMLDPFDKTKLFCLQAHVICLQIFHLS